MQPRPITPSDTDGLLDWPGAIHALRSGHLLPRAQIADLFLGPATATLLNRAAWIEGLGFGVKAVTVVDANPVRGLPTVQGSMMVFDPDLGHPSAIIDAPLITEWKTAADSVLGAMLLARPDSRSLLIVGAGTLARSLVRAYAAMFPGLRDIAIWARRGEQAAALVAELGPHYPALRVAEDLPQAVGQADIVSTATMARAPVLLGAWVRPGTHVDLIGAYKADMREADDALIALGRLFVDSRDTTIGHIGELMIPMASGVIGPIDVLGDLYDLVGADAPGRQDPQDITIFKNGGGAHLDLMIATYIAQAIKAGA
ncbi:ornithine cyclodeaminase family protein [Paracoccus shanxieyensis]|uniref:Ornithine cyclodeaminase n=1 Tax=Paracoccus shanxieyensis TaxID=2675752 RepID=A0A6L6IWI0_9RHOB|nr:ornithine cyclodeaminase [Paracoccus shanxieyensis]MTH64249.1 ornithine cyclodeaminase [Paracoccus shanxieyensis]MTH87393.1 ornithine cyclodeaminase [Paracoccus shanxieyensis]